MMFLSVQVPFDSFTIMIFICPIAIAYSMGQIIKSVSVCLSVCPCVVTLTIAFLCEFSPNLTHSAKSKNDFVGGPHRFPYFTPKNRHFWFRGPENQCKDEKRNICLKCSRIAQIPACHKKSGSANTMLTSDV